MPPNFQSFLHKNIRVCFGVNETFIQWKKKMRLFFARAGLLGKPFLRGASRLIEGIKSGVNSIHVSSSWWIISRTFLKGWGWGPSDWAQQFSLHLRLFDVQAAQQAHAALEADVKCLHKEHQKCCQRPKLLTSGRVVDSFVGSVPRSSLSIYWI